MKRGLFLLCTIAVSAASLFALPLSEDQKRIFDLQNARDTDGLIAELANEKAGLRALAAEALASVQNVQAVPELAKALSDKDSRVRAAAAYALGQIADTQAVQPLSAVLDTETVPHVKRVVYEAIGKCADADALSLILMRGKKEESILVREGVILGIYRAAVWKKVMSDEGTAYAVDLIAQTNPQRVRLYAANYLSRIRDVNLSNYLPQIRAAIQSERAADISAALILSLNKAVSPDALAVFSDIMKQGGDYRFKVSALRAMNAYEWSDVRAFALRAVLSPQPNIAAEAADLIAAKAGADDVPALTDAAEKASAWYARITLIGTVYQLTEGEAKAARNDELIKGYNEATLMNIKAQLLYVLGSDTGNAEFVAAESLKHVGNVIATNGFTVLSEQCGVVADDPQLKQLYADTFKRAIEMHDAATISIVAEPLCNPDYGFKDVIQDTAFLQTALDAMKLPKDIDGYTALVPAIEFFTGAAPAAAELVTPRPIQWETLDAYTTRPAVLIKTNKGTFKMELYPEKSPASVVNFLELAKSGYFDGKTFHRVVSNFVVQGGCERGDGYGSPDYVIASEFGSYYYETGSVGMASAGKDTEGTQWFVTHMPTPHLDGRYTIFAKVVTGMKTVNALEIGDAIISVTVK